MTTPFHQFLAASSEDRRDAFLGAARRLGTAEQNIEKDFWVCWTLDVLFNAVSDNGPRLLFKGGTSLSKAYGLISRFSEDIDITIFRDDLGEGATVEELESLSGKKRKAKLDAIKAASQAYIADPLRNHVGKHLSDAFVAAGLPGTSARIDLDPDDPDSQSLLVWYPQVTPRADGYVRPAIKIESGAKSALDPNQPVSIRPYVADDLPGIDLAVNNITTVVAERTFWDKVVIVHGLRRWFDKRGQLRGGGQRVSRHYYDLYRLLDSESGASAAKDLALAEDCVRHAQMFFNSPDLDLANAGPGAFSLSPSLHMATSLARDYMAMSGMIFGPVPDFKIVLERITDFESTLNAANRG